MLALASSVPFFFEFRVFQFFSLVSLPPSLLFSPKSLEFFFFSKKPAVYFMLFAGPNAWDLGQVRFWACSRRFQDKLPDEGSSRRQVGGMRIATRNHSSTLTS